MGACCGKGSNANGIDETGGQTVSVISSPDGNPSSHFDPVQHVRELIGYKSATIDKLVLETLVVIRTLLDNDLEPPPSIMKLNYIADKDKGWLALVNSIVNVIPKDDPLGPAVITLLLDDCPLPTKETVAKLSKMFGLSSEIVRKGENNSTRHRNICIVLGCIAEKLAGPGSEALLTSDTLDYLITNLNPNQNASVILHSLIALEKFAQTSINKTFIEQRLALRVEHPFEVLERFEASKKYVEKQVGFCARWSMDNQFIVKDRKCTYEIIDRTNLNAMLNANDVSEYLKISADGLTARCDASSFESVRCTFPVKSGVWYYEVTLITAGVMQIGWATRNSKFLNHDGFGIGDDEYSLAYDGCRKLIWYNAGSSPHKHPCWKPGDVLGCLLDLDNEEIIFSLNGHSIPPRKEIFKQPFSAFFAAASFMSFQQCEFNFGRTSFKYPPKKINFQSFNSFNILSEDDKIILPNYIKLQKLRDTSFDEGSCSLCFDNVAKVRLDPCQHTGFCSYCAIQLEVCPICRTEIGLRIGATL